MSCLLYNHLMILIFHLHLHSQKTYGRLWRICIKLPWPRWPYDLSDRATKVVYIIRQNPVPEKISRLGRSNCSFNSTYPRWCWVARFHVGVTVSIWWQNNYTLWATSGGAVVAFRWKNWDFEAPQPLVKEGHSALDWSLKIGGIQPCGECLRYLQSR